MAMTRSLMIAVVAVAMSACSLDGGDDGGGASDARPDAAPPDAQLPSCDSCATEPSCEAGRWMCRNDFQVFPCEPSSPPPVPCP